MDQVPNDPRPELRQRLSEWRTEFHALVDRISPDEWEGKSGNAAWSVRQVVGHLAAQPDACVRLVDLTRRGQGMLNRPPARVLDLVNLWMVRLTTRGETPVKARDHFDAGHRLLVARLEDIRVDEFSIASRSFRQPISVADCFRGLGSQLADHGPQVLAGIRPTSPATGPVGTVARS
ncbi:MAG: maleylpyruvate isomerase N-terminal domain-containing protein [Chloroflexota bacterium]